MKRHFLVVALLATSLILGISGSSLSHAQTDQEKQSAAPSTRPPKSAQVDALLAPFSQGNIPGVAILVIQGMNHTLIWNEAKPKVERLALSYAPKDNSFTSIDYVSDSFLYGPKGVITTTEDLFKWSGALETEKLVKAATLRQAFTPMKLNDGSESSYGFGWFIGKDRGLELIEHAGGYLGYRTDIGRYPSQHTTIVVLSNNAQVEAAPLAKRIARIYLADKMIAPTAVKLDAGLLSRYVGKYKSGSSALVPDLLIEITLENGELYITSPIRPKAKLLAQTATEFIISETTATVTFTKNDPGGVTGLTLKARMGTINAPRLAP